MRPWLLMALALAAGTGELRAEPARAEAVARARVRVRLVGALGREATLRDRIQSWFDPAKYEVALQGAAYLDPNQVLSPESGLLVDAWVTQRGAHGLRLYFVSVDAETRKPRYLLRDLQLERGLDEVAAEELAQAVHLSASALVEGQLASSREQVEQSLREAPAEEPAEKPSLAAAAAPSPTEPDPALDVEQPTSSAALALHGAVGYAAAPRGDEGFAHGPRGRLALIDGASGWGTFARLNVVVPHRVVRAELDLKLYGGAALLAVTFQGTLAGRVTVTGFAGPSLELVRFRAAAQPGKPFEPAPAETELRPLLGVGAVVAFGEYPRLALVPELTIGLKDTHYDVARAGLTETVARASRVTACLGLELEL